MADIQAFLQRVLSGGLQRNNHYRCKLDLAGLFADQIGTTGGGGGTSNNPFRAGVEVRAALNSAIELLREGLLCRTTMTPSRQFEITNVNLAGGYDETYAVGTTYDDLECVFLCPLIGGETASAHMSGPDSTATNPVLTLFHAWQNLIQNRGKVGEDADMVLAFPKTYRLAQGMRLEMFTGRVPKNVFAAEASTNRLERMLRDTPDLNPEQIARIRENIARQMVVDNARQISTAFEYFNVYPVRVDGTTVDWLGMDEAMEITVSFSYTHWQQAQDKDLNP